MKKYPETSIVKDSKERVTRIKKFIKNNPNYSKMEVYRKGADRLMELEAKELHILKRHEAIRILEEVLSVGDVLNMFSDYQLENLLNEYNSGNNKYFHKIQ